MSPSGATGERGYELIIVDEPVEMVRRITLNRPEKRNAISTPLRVELLDALRAHDHDPSVRVTVIRGAGPCFSSGYDLSGAGSGSMMDDAPFYSAPGDGQWARQCNDTWFSIWDLAKPVIAQIHGYAIAGGTELASACDLVYVASDARISYPVVRVASPPDWQYHTVLLGMRRAMELMLTGDPISGEEAAAIGFANRAFAADELDAKVLEIAVRIAGVPSELQQINKRSVHRAMDVWGARAAIRAGSELQALAGHTPAALAFRENALAAVKKAVAEKAE
jgi:enoyl-CoA hydratase